MELHNHIDPVPLQEIDKAGATYIQLLKKDYVSLLDALEDARDMEAVHDAQHRIASGEETFPVELIERLIGGENPVKTYRKYRGMTQQQLMDVSKVNRNYISEIETGKKPGSVKALKAIASVLRVDLDDLV